MKNFEIFYFYWKLIMFPVRGLSGKYRAYLYITALALFFIIGRVASSKVIPIWLNNTIPAIFHFSKQSWNSLLGMALSTLVALFLTVVLSSNRCHLSVFLSCGNSQKSQGAMSGLYGGCLSNAVLCLLRDCCTRFDECAGALSWWRIQSPHTRESFLKSCSKFPKQ